MTQYLGIDWLAMCLTFWAIYLLGDRNRYGFIVIILVWQISAVRQLIISMTVGTGSVLARWFGVTVGI